MAKVARFSHTKIKRNQWFSSSEGSRYFRGWKYVTFGNEMLLTKKRVTSENNTLYKRAEFERLLLIATKIIEKFHFRKVWRKFDTEVSFSNSFKKRTKASTMRSIQWKLWKVHLWQQLFLISEGTYSISVYLLLFKNLPIIILSRPLLFFKFKFWM